MKHTLDRASHWLARICLVLSATCLMLLMLLTVAEVVARYGFNAPIFGRQDLAQILLACSIFFAVPVVTIRGQQIDVDLLDGLFSERAAFWRDRAIEALMAGTFLVMGVWLAERAEKAFSRGSTSELLFLPKSPLIWFVAATVFVTGVLVALRCLYLTFLSKKEQDT
ncbi:TRAP transporter small permease [uncultured Litoreibacter sp.]|uniref:TRAP transporter small permease n=1 Tax=uncultured Litoreibacter sp. TaxID=1392394 RepID=UPI0026354BC1|nr:TRAP transporter small permease [uncultured Litoreibacter sp.]